MRSSYVKHERFPTFCEGPSETKQSFQDETDINNVLAKYQKTGLIDHVRDHGGVYADMPGYDDFHHAMNVVTDAQQMFNDLPATVRRRFGNDPSEFLEFVADEGNRDELIKLGVIAEPEPVAEEVEATELDAAAIAAAAAAEAAEAALEAP